MKNFNKNSVSALWALPLLALAPLPVYAQLVITDTLTGAASKYGWTTTGGACLTAGDGSTSSIPACATLPYYSGKIQVGGVTGRLPDPVGQGALRLTNGDITTGTNGNNNTGSVISTSPFPTSQGVRVTFTTATYGGNAYSNNNGEKSGADGLAFFLMDGSRSPSIGAFGGSLGYSCSQGKSPADGVDGGYLGVGIDEFGNFSNRNDSTSDGLGPNPGTIAVRGAGSVTYAALNRDYPSYYPAASKISAANQLAAVQNTCRTGALWNYTLSTPKQLSQTLPDYNLIGLPYLVPTPIFNQEAINKPLRSAAKKLTYDLSITQDNFLSLSYSVDNGISIPVIPKQSITAGNGPLPSSFKFGFTSGTGGGSNVHEILCFKASQITTATNSAGTNAQQSSKVESGSQVYLSYFHELNSWGQMTASNLVSDASGNVSIDPVANWDASCVLTGGTCDATGNSTTAQTPTSRPILSWNGSAGVPFRYGNLSLAQQLLIGSLLDGTTRVNYLRGDRSNEIPLSGFSLATFRRRDGVLGDIRNSSPTWVGPPALSYATASTDLLTNTAVAGFGASYKKFISDNATRANVVYVGANDGMLHGFRAGAYDASQAFSTATTPNDGLEVLGYVPGAVVGSIHPLLLAPALDFSSPQYAHNSYVDATPGTGDLYYSGAWHTWLVGGLGPGGNVNGTINDLISTTNGVLYALDITDPSQFKESNAASLVVGEWNPSNITCSNVSNCGTHMGNLYGTPLIRRLHDGNWAVIFGNGRNSATGTSGIFIMTVNASTGVKTFRFLNTGAASLTSKNGIDFVSSADLDGDHVTDYLYAGDFQGKVWRFDLTSSDPTQWAASSAPLFTTAAGQPISTSVTVNSVPQVNGAPRLVIAFGTGRQLPQTLSSAASYASGGQAMYGIWDWNLTTWNTKSATKYQALTSPQSFSATDLAQQTITSYAGSSGDIDGYRTVSQNKVCWKGSTVCTTGNTQFGWKLTLPSTTSEQLIFNPVLTYGTLVFNTFIPAVIQTLSCIDQPASGYTMAISPETGGALIKSPFNSASTAAGFTAPAAAIISGLGLSATGSPSAVSSFGKVFLVQQTVSGTGVATQLDLQAGALSRVTWVKLR